MAALVGLLSDLKFSFDNKVTWLTPDNLLDFDIDEPTSLIENTSHTSRQKTYMTERTDPSGIANFITNNTSAVQNGLKLSNRNSTSFHAQWYDLLLVGEEVREGEVLLESYTKKSPRDGEQTLDISFKFASAIINNIQ